MDEEKEDDWVEIEGRLYFMLCGTSSARTLTEMPSNGWPDCSPTRSTHDCALAVRKGIVDAQKR